MYLRLYVGLFEAGVDYIDMVRSVVFSILNNVKVFLFKTKLKMYLNATMKLL